MKALSIPENYIKNIKLTDEQKLQYYTSEELKTYNIDYMKLYAIIPQNSISSEIATNNNEIYNNIVFMEIGINKLKFSSDLYRIMLNIIRKINYCTIVSIKLDSKTIYGSGLVRINKNVQDRNVAITCQFTQLIYNDFRNSRITKFYNEINKTLANIKNTKETFSNINKQISILDAHFFTLNNIKRYLAKLDFSDYSKDLIENSFKSKISIHENKFDFNTEKTTVGIESESLYRAICLNKETNALIKAKTIPTTFHDFLRQEYDDTYDEIDEEEIENESPVFITPYERDIEANNNQHKKNNTPPFSFDALQNEFDIDFDDIERISFTDIFSEDIEDSELDEFDLLDEKEKQKNKK